MSGLPAWFAKGGCDGPSYAFVKGNRRDEAETLEPADVGAPV